MSVSETKELAAASARAAAEVAAAAKAVDDAGPTHADMRGEVV